MATSSVTAKTLQTDFMQTLYLDVDNQLDLNLRLPSNDKEAAPKIRLPSFGPNDFEALSKEFVTKSPASPVANTNMTPPSSPIPTSKREAKPSSTPPTVDPYLSSIVSSAKPSKVVASSDQDKSSSCMCARCKGKPSGQPVHCKNPVDCPCYRCQKQRRRALTLGKNNTPNTNVSTATKTSTREPEVPVPRRVQSSKESKENSRPIEPQLLKAQTLPAARALGLRKKPSILSYNKHRRKDIEPSDSIYDSTGKEKRSSTHTADDRSMVSHTTVDSYCSNEDKYEISWKDETAGDDILEPLKCFIDIFEKKPDDKPDGLSDLLEDGARNLQMQKKLEAQRAKQARQKQDEEKLPPRLDVLTPSYRHGPAHKSLTLYHLMKCKQRKDRLMAYSIAYNNCINGNSGLNDWMNKQTAKGLPTPMLAYTPQQQRKQSKKPMFRSPLKHTPSVHSRPSQDKQMYLSQNNNSAFLTPMNDMSTRLSNDSARSRPTDVLKAASALLPGSIKNPDLNRSHTNLGITKSYNHIDIPRRPRGRSSSDHGTTSQSSEEEKLSVATIKQVSHVVDPTRSGNHTESKLSSQPILNTAPKDRVVTSEQPPAPSGASSNALDDLCSVLPHVERSTLQTYLNRADGDYMKALDLCKTAVVSGEM